MADQPVTREKLINADKDVQVIEDFIKKSKDETVTTRFGDEIMTLKGLEEEVKKSGGYFKRYTTLAAANADIANIPVNSVVKVTDAVNGGDYEKVSAEATSLTKSPHDPLTQAKSYTNQVAKDIPGILGNIGVFVDGAYLKLSSTGKIYKEPFPDVKTIILDVSPGEDYLLYSSSYGGVVKPYYVVDASGNVITEPQLIQGATLYGISIPTNGVKLYVNRPNTVISTFSLRRSSKIDNKVAEKVIDVEARLYNGLDSWFTDGAPSVNQTVVNTGTALEISYTSNPRVMNAIGQAAYLFPQGATNFSLPPLPAYSVMYVEALAKNTYSATKYLQLSDIKIVSFLNNIDLSGKTILAVNSGGTHPSFVGAVGRKYRDDLTFQINTIKNNVASLSDNVTSLSDKVDGFIPPSGVATTFPEKPNYQGVLREKCPSFYEHYKLKDKDVVVCLSGSSMTQGNLYATNRPDGTTRPPLMHTNDYASHIYDKLEIQWDKQQYRRYDHADLTYVGGGWAITNDLKVDLESIWDDRGERHNGLTKTTTDPSAKVSTAIPKGAFQFNFIYRTDSNGATSKVSIAEGAGKVEVYDGSAWVEAHNYNFSMLETPATETKGNTVYQKRLKMRCKNRYIEGGIDSRGAAKTITISNTSSTSGNFNVVGFEWSPREFMLTIINAARGGGQWGVDSASNLEKFQDGDIWIHKPDLVLMEVTGINWGASADIYGDYRSYINIARRTYFNEFNDSPNSYAEKSLLAGNETLFYASSVSAASAYDYIFDTESGDQLFGTITKPERNGAAGVPEDTSRLGGVTNGFDNMYAIDHYMQSKGVFYAQSTAAFKEVAEKYYDGFYFAMRPSGKSGLTLSADGTHYNDNGAALWAHMITSVFDNL